MQCVLLIATPPPTPSRSTLFSSTQLCVPFFYQGHFVLPKCSWICALLLQSGQLTRATHSQRKGAFPLPAANNCQLLAQKWDFLAPSPLLAVLVWLAQDLCILSQPLYTCVFKAPLLCPEDFPPVVVYTLASTLFPTLSSTMTPEPLEEKV